MSIAVRHRWRYCARRFEAHAQAKPTPPRAEGPVAPAESASPGLSCDLAASHLSASTVGARCCSDYPRFGDRRSRISLRRDVRGMRRPVRIGWLLPRTFEWPPARHDLKACRVANLLSFRPPRLTSGSSRSFGKPSVCFRPKPDVRLKHQEAINLLARRRASLTRLPPRTRSRRFRLSPSRHRPKELLSF